jgi:hypothetical protein
VVINGNYSSDQVARVILLNSMCSFSLCNKKIKSCLPTITTRRELKKDRVSG